MTPDQEREAKLQIHHAIIQTIAWAARVPEETDPFERSFCACGQQLKREHADKMTDWQKRIHEKIESQIPDKAKELTRAMLGHMNECEGFKARRLAQRAILN